MPTPADPALSPLPAAPSPSGPNPMETHVKVIGIVDIVVGCLAALAGLVLLFVFSVGTAVTGATTRQGTPGWVPGFLAGLGLMLALFLAVFAVLFILAGTALLRRRRSARVLGIVAACFQLLSFPLGTAFGIYALVILTRPDTERLLVN